MPRLKKRFECGHRGFGKFCHRCADAERATRPVKPSDVAADIEAAMKGGSKSKAKKKRKKRR